MLQSEIEGLTYFPPSNPAVFPANLAVNQSNSPPLQLSRLIPVFPNYQTPTPAHEFTPNYSCISSNSTSDEADDHHLRIIDERRQRRMISNRESARRSRMRKQRQFDELWSQVLRLRMENQNLVHQLNQVRESHDRAARENGKLREEASDLRRMLMDFQVQNSCTGFRDFEEVPCNSNHVRSESA